MFRGSTFGDIFRISTFGESHGKGQGVIIEGCPSGMTLDLDAIRSEMDRRKPGQSKLVTQRQESDEFEFYSGLFEGRTTGTPLMALILNRDARSRDYSEIKDLFRPGHADYSYFAKYGHRDYRGGGRSSARETAARVLAGAVAKQILNTHGISIFGAMIQLGSVKAVARDWQFVEHNDLRSPDPQVVAAMEDELQKARKDLDSLGAVVEIMIAGVPAGLGEPVFGRLDAALAAAMMSIPATKGVEFGSGFQSVEKRGSELNDQMSSSGFLSNNHGGILGGISTGTPIVLRFALKPTSSLARPQATIDSTYQDRTIQTKGRHDPCVGIRAVPVGEAMCALVVVDFLFKRFAEQQALEAYEKLHVKPYGLA